jgi:hypothetical protein
VTTANRPIEYAYVSASTSMSHAEPLVTVHEVGPFDKLYARMCAPYVCHAARADRFDPFMKEKGIRSMVVTDYVRAASVQTSYMRPAVESDYARAFSMYNYDTNQFERRYPFGNGG